MNSTPVEQPSSMARLGARVLRELPAGLATVPAYDVASVQPTVVHIGPGVFHRGHQAVYADTVLGTGSTAGGICAVALRSSDLRDSLHTQDHLYSLVERAHSGDRMRVIGAIRETLVAADGSDAVLAKMTDPAISVVTITVTEKGYCAVGSTGELDISRPEIVHDIGSPQAPVSLPGFLVEALAQRRLAGVEPFAVVSCDNLQSNGVATRRLVVELAGHRDGDLADWIAGAVAFPSSMVDRMVPATTDDIRALVADSLGYHDESTVVTEPFSQWVLEDGFPGGRPAWERAGVELVSDVAPFEQAKLRILNGAHSAFAYFGLLLGHAVIADAVADAQLRSHVLAMLVDEVIPTLRAPRGMDLAAYAEEVLGRFGNRTLGYTTAKVAGDGSQKLGARNLGTVRDRLEAGAGIDRLASVVAAYAACVLGPRSGEFGVQDPALERLLGRAPEPITESGRAVDLLLGISDIFGDVSGHPVFGEAVRRHAAALWLGDPRAAIPDSGRGAR